MTLGQFELLLLALVCFSLHDYLHRTIPPWLCLTVAALIAAAWMVDQAEWWWSSAVLAALLFWLAGLPMGDRAGIFVVGGLLTPVEACQVTLLSVGVGLLYLEGFGRRRSMIGVPFFPAVAVCAMVIVAWHQWG